ncbi:trace amine-associated receptor 9-like [Branchiostoma lanceolatum]|uniref:trace amine-associated receptor 9-like n=1 Tax=Branchiostoma lanceolatum TaxID=7740 RepID=UPI003451134D
MNGSELADDPNGTTSVSAAEWQHLLPAELKATFVGLIDLWLVLGNIFVVVVILRSPSLRNYTGYLTVSLACADMLPGLLVMPFSVRPAWTGHWTYGDTLCMLTTFFSCVSTMASTFSLVGLAINRYILIVHALKYQSIVGPKLCTSMIAAAWILPVMSFSINIFDHKRYHFLPSAAHCTFDFGGVAPLAVGIAFATGMVLLVGILHCKVYAVARRHLNNIYHYNPHATEDKLQGAKTTAAITLTFFLTWVPYSVLAICQQMLKYTTHPDVEFAVYWLHGCHGILNVFIYSGLNRAFRDQAKRLVVSGRTYVLQCLEEATRPSRVDVTLLSPQVSSINISNDKGTGACTTHAPEDILLKELGTRDLDNAQDFESPC